MARSSSSKPPSRRPSPPPRATTPTPPSQSQSLSQKPKSKSKAAKRKDDYSSEGVEDNDVFLLPGSDFQLVLAITVISAAVRLFRIYQPSSVVFDEVQYVGPQPPMRCDTGADHAIATASAALLPSTSRADSSWTCTPRSRS